MGERLVSLVDVSLFRFLSYGEVFYFWGNGELLFDLNS